MKIAGKEYPIKLGLNQSIEYCELRGITINQMNDDFTRMANGEGTGSEIRDLLWSVLKDGARVAGTKFTMSNYDVGDLIEAMSTDEMTEFMEELAGSMPKKQPNAKKKAVAHA